MSQTEFEEFLKIQLEAICEYRRVKSKEEGHDIGKERACKEWIAKNKSADL